MRAPSAGDDNASRSVPEATPTTDLIDMEPTYFAQYRGFEFQCSPERLGTRAFAPRLVIYDAYESVSLEIPIGVPTPPFDDPTAAAHQAFAHGRRWVDRGFGPADASLASGLESPKPTLTRLPR